MTTEHPRAKPPNVPKQVFEEFLEALGQSGVSVEVVDRLRKTLLENKKYTEPALKAAVLHEESPR